MACLFMLFSMYQAPEQPADVASLFSQADAQWASYMKAIQHLEFRETSYNYQNGKLTSIGQRTACLFPNAFITVSRTAFPPDTDYYSGNLPYVTLLRAKGDHYEEFQFKAMREISEEKELSLQTFAKRYEWYGANGKYLKLTDSELPAYVTNNYHPAPCLAYKNTPYIYYYHEIIAAEHVRLDSVKLDGDKLHIEYSVNNPNPKMPFINKRGNFTLLKNQFWHLLGGENEESRSQNLGAVSFKYTTFESIPVLLQYERSFTFGKSTNQFAVNRFKDTSVLLLNTYGIGEQEISPPLDPTASVISINKSKPENVWLWPTMIACVILVLGLWFRNRYRIRIHS